MVALGSVVLAAVAEAHTGERAYLRLLPTEHYLWGGALVVALSFALVGWLPRGLGARLRSSARALVTLHPPRWPSAITLALLVMLVASGLVGRRDPLDNPLPTVVWSVWWAGFTAAHALLGNLWGVLSPWPALYRLVRPGASRARARRLRYPSALGTWPAVGVLAVFAWTELVYPAPQDPARLAVAVAAYAAFTALGMAIFGPRAWLARAEAFTVYFRMVARNAPLATRAAGDGRRTVVARWPASGLLAVRRWSPSQTAFVLLALSAVSFDGLSRTFWWVSAIGHNPLEYPGRTVLMAWNTLGLLGTFTALAAGYLLAVALGRRLGGPPTHHRRWSVLVGSIVPIAFGYHLAHYLPYLIVDAQYALRAMGDPFDLDWNLLGLRDLHVHAAFLSDHVAVVHVWRFQVAAIVGAHVLAVLVAHAALLDARPPTCGAAEAPPRGVWMSLTPLTVLMVGYTVLGLWLLSTPSVG